MLLVSFFVSNASAEKAISVLINGQPLILDVSPKIENGRTLVPLGPIFSALGANVQWNPDEQSITATRGNQVLKLVVGSSTAYNNGNPLTIDVAPMIVDGRTLVPLGFVAQTMGAQVTWDSANYQVLIVSSGQSNANLRNNETALTNNDTKPNKSAKELFLALPGESWALGLDIDGFDITKWELNKEGNSCYFLANNPTTNVTMSVCLEKENLNGDAKKVREYYWNKLKANTNVIKENVVMRETDIMAILEYSVPKYNNAIINQQNINAYMVQEDIWIDIHLSKVDYKAGEEKYFKDFLDKVRIQLNYIPGIDEYFMWGSNFFINKNNEKAIVCYEKALALEKQERKLDQGYFNLVVDNLGFLYGISGELEKARETLEYGIANDATYTMFYYDLACVYAEYNNMAKTIEYLEKAYQYKNNMPKGKFPDPSKDESFKKFMNNEFFLSELIRIAK